MKLIAYTLNESDAAHYPLEPAPVKRDWMNVGDRLANRCLPLTLANQAGWIIRSPAAFDVHPTGDDGIDSLSFRFATQQHAQWAPNIRCLFGHRIVTFSLPYLFATESRVQLRVSGLPNYWVLGAHPLEGIVETDWLPFTFTMNWRIEGHARFQKGDPICFIQPLSTALLTACEPERRRLSDDPALARQYAEYAASRDAFNGVQTKPETHVAGDWQGEYTSQARLTKLSLKGFSV